MQETKTRDQVIEEIREEIAGAQDRVMTTTLSDLIRLGSTKTTQEVGGWGEGETACALSAAAYAAEAIGVFGSGRG